jgi:endonuclease/exonuclease/phosphatase family metal-dependent hydrolase
MTRILFLFSLFCAAISLNAQSTYNVMTFNLRYNNPDDKEDSWPFRKAHACEQIQFYEADILGVQEGLADQIEDLTKCLPGFEYVGTGRDDGKTKGEYSAIFYRSSMFRLLKQGQFWLSPTPDVPNSKGWDAACTRICTWALLEDKKIGKSFYVFNTHMDHIGKTARVESVKMILERIDATDGLYPVMLMGDFNATPSDNAVKSVTEGNNKIKLQNTYNICQTPHFGPTGSFNGFKGHELSDEPIDHIFVSPEFKSLKHGTLSETWNGRFSSDHFPVWAKVEVRW